MVEVQSSILLISQPKGNGQGQNLKSHDETGENNELSGCNPRRVSSIQCTEKNYDLLGSEMM